MWPSIGLVLLAGAAAANVQQPFSAIPSREVETNEYQFAWPIHKVAVIGAGPNGLVAYRELTEAGLQVRVFERESVPGGNWHYTDDIPLDAPVPNAPCPIGSYVPSLPPEGVDLPYSEELENDGEILRDHRAPKPVWESMTSNTASRMHQFPQWPWPDGTQWELSQYQVRNYLRSYASYNNINSNDENPATAYDTRVERVEKRVNEAGQEQGWRLWLRSLKPTQNNTYRATWWTEDFDAVIIAVGRYHAPTMPSIPGLDEWVRRFPDLVRHGRQYRRPDPYANQTVLIVGASDSGAGISRDLNLHASKIYQSARPAKDNRSRAMLERNLRRIPLNTTLVGEIKQFLPIPEGSPIQSGFIELNNGTILSGIDSMILATGYRFSFPFLPQYYDDATYEPHAGSAAAVSPFLPLDGSHIRDLYLDQFYSRDPTLAFFGVVLGSSSFLGAEYTTLAAAKVWTNKAKLPNSEAMQAWCKKTVEERGGYGKFSLSTTSGQFFAHISYLIGWLNEAAVKYGGKQVDGVPKYTSEVIRYWLAAHFGGSPKLVEPGTDKAELASLELARGVGAVQGWVDVFLDGDW